MLVSIHGRRRLWPNAGNFGGLLRTFDLRPELTAIRSRTLLFAGRHDWICAPEFSEEIDRLIPGSELEVFEDSSHSARVAAPERLQRAIREFQTG